MDRLRGVAVTLKKTYGARATGNAQATATRDRRVSTGSFDLDYILGGGLSIGRNTMFFGEKSGGKTTSAIRCMGILQNSCQRCLRRVADIQPIPPPADVLEEDPNARWSARGTCDCYRTGVVTVPDPSHKEFGETSGSKAHKAKLETWQEAMKLNSYVEYVVCFVDPEDSFDPVWAEKLGADPKRIFFALSSTGEEGVDMVLALIASGGADMVVIDSLAHFTPRKEYEESAEDWQQGLQARIVNKGIRKWVTGGIQTKRNGGEVTQIWINQIRMKIGAFGDPNVKPAGKGQDFAVHAEVKFLAPRKEVISEQYGSKKELIEMEVHKLFRFKSTKNKTGGDDGISGEYVMLTRDTDTAKAGDVQEHEKIFKLALHYLVEKTKKGYAMGDGLVFKTQSAILETLRSDAELFAAVRKTLLKRLLG
jgi:RecA/RadA recombinase